MRLPEGTLAELLDGDLYMSPSPKYRHQRIVSNLHFLLRGVIEGRQAGVVIDSPMDVHLPTGDIVQPDVVIVLQADRDIIQDWIRGAPTVLVEVLSPESADRDRIIKKALYARNGVKEYWIVDGDAPAVQVLELGNDGFVESGYFEGDDTLTSTVLDNLQLPLTDIFAN